jgi:hypothetical protein
MMSSIRSRKAALGLLSCFILVACCHGASAAIISLEPDSFAPGTDLDTIQPGLTLGVFNTILNALEPTVITTVESIVDTHASTGNRVFGANGFANWTDTRQFNMTFGVPTDFVSLDFIGSSSIAQIGKLDIFNSIGTLLGTYTTASMTTDQVETMSFTRMSPDIKFARAYTAPGSIPFGRLDNLSFNQPIAVPEPTALCLIGVALAFACCVRRPAR